MSELKNVQRYSFQLTINNPLDKGVTHHEIKRILTTEFTTTRFFCMADEIGEQGTPHTHIYVCFSSRVRWSTVKKHFPDAHIEIAHGTARENVDYIKKQGKWEDDKKAETRVEGTYEEWGTIPNQKGLRIEMEELYSLIKEGYSNSDIIAFNNDYILDIDKLDKLRTTLLIDKYKGTRRLNLKVIYISGATGMGKTRGVLDTHGDANVYRVSDYAHAFDGYACEPVIVFDEFRSSLRLADMLGYCDIYPIQLPARYNNKVACYETVYIISNWELEKQYAEVQKDSPESWKAFLRRIHEVRIYNHDGSIDIYDSVENYLNRNLSFHKPNQNEVDELPFT